MASKFIIIIFLVLNVLVSNAYAISKLYRGGNVEIILKDSLPCFYIHDSHQKGNYSLVGDRMLQEQKNEWFYDNSFEVKTPDKQNCILWGQEGFSSKDKPILYTPYGITFGTEKKAYYTSFCLAQKEGKTIIQEVKNNKCYEPPKGMWQLIKEALNW